jgi:CHAT domain-containing protein/tetratricopeptide (TPR) repeat protein
MVILAALPCVASRHYIALYLSRRPVPARPTVNLLQDPAASRNPQILLAEGDRLAFLFNWPRAKPFYQRAEELYGQKGDTRNETYARIGRVFAEGRSTSLEEASESLKQELNLPVVKQDRRLRLWCLALKGSIDLNLAPASAKRDLLEARELAHELHDDQWEARATGELGIEAFLEGDAGRAANLAGQAYLSAIATGDIGSQIRYLQIMGGGFNALTRHKEALTLFNRAIKLSNATEDAGFPYMAFQGKAEALTAEGQFQDAKVVLDQALAAVRRDEIHVHESTTLIYLGELSLKTGDRDAGKNYLLQAAEIGEEYKFYRGIAQAMVDLVQEYRNEGDLKSAEKSVSRAINATRRAGDRYSVPRDLTMLAELKARRGEVREASALYENAEDVIDGMVVNLHEPYWSSSLAGAMSQTYLGHFELEAAQGKTRQAFDVVERIRGQTATALLRKEIHVGEEGSEKLQTLNDNISGVQLRLMRSEDSQERARLLDQLTEWEHELEWTETGEDRLEPHAWFERPAPLRSVRESLQPDEIVLEYVLGEPQTYCLWVSKKGAGLERLSAGRERIEVLTKQFLRDLGAKRDDSETARQLFDVLLGPVRQRILGRSLIIVPDGILHLLPFEALLDPAGKLLIENGAVGYSPASTVLTFLRNATKPRQASGLFLGLGDVPYQDQGGVSEKIYKPTQVTKRILRGFSDTFGTPLYDLPRTREEVLKISKNFGQQAVLLLGDQATETAFKSQPLEKFQILHLAVHGFADPEFPERSGLVLGVDPRSHDDGLLQVREISRLQLNADLVTLSACDTAVGKLHGEEGITDVAEAFLASGARTVVASLWSADDTYTLALMERFYYHLAEGEDTSSALRHAKLDLLSQNGRRLSPYYWAAFVLIGDGASRIRPPKAGAPPN